MLYSVKVVNTVKIITTSSYWSISKSRRTTIQYFCSAETFQPPH